jgi:hypothetical protein
MPLMSVLDNQLSETEVGLRLARGGLRKQRDPDDYLNSKSKKRIDCGTLWREYVMMKRPRLSRPLCVSILALAGLLVLSYFPLSRIRAANAGATILPSAGKPLVNLKTAQNLKVTYTGPAAAALQAGTATPTALAAADFNADGAIDVVAGYSTANGGVIALFRGNPDAYAPTDTMRPVTNNAVPSVAAPRMERLFST